LFFQNGLSCPPVLSLGSFFLFFVFFIWLSIFFFAQICFLDPLDFSSCSVALFGHL
jgi:hypothetical protein